MLKQQIDINQIIDSPSHWERFSYNTSASYQCVTDYLNTKKPDLPEEEKTKVVASYLAMKLGGHDFPFERGD